MRAVAVTRSEELPPERLEAAVGGKTYVPKASFGYGELERLGLVELPSEAIVTPNLVGDALPMFFAKRKLDQLLHFDQFAVFLVAQCGE